MVRPMDSNPPAAEDPAPRAPAPKRPRFASLAVGAVLGAALGVLVVTMFTAGEPLELVGGAVAGAVGLGVVAHFFGDRISLGSYT
jgi:hypothetical protein